MSQIVRQLDLLRELCVRTYGATYQELMGLYNVSKRTIQRDIEALSEIGFMIDKETRGGSNYFTARNNLPPLNFPIDEIIALIFIEGIVSPLGDTPYQEAFQKTLNRIRTTLPEQMRVFLEHAGAAYYSHHRGQKAQTDPEIFKTAHRAIKERKVCNITYHAITTGQIKTYPIKPLRFLYYHNGYYLLCLHPNDNNLLTLAAERIRALETTSQTFEPPDAEAIENRIKPIFGITLKDPIAVKVQFSATQAPYIQQRTWHPSQEIEQLANGEIILSFQASGLYEIKSWILSHGADAKVLAPDSLRQEIIEELQKNLTFYQKN